MWLAHLLLPCLLRPRPGLFRRRRGIFCRKRQTQHSTTTTTTVRNTNNVDNNNNTNNNNNNNSAALIFLNVPRVCAGARRKGNGFDPSLGDASLPSYEWSNRRLNGSRALGVKGESTNRNVFFFAGFHLADFTNHTLKALQINSCSIRLRFTPTVTKKARDSAKPQSTAVEQHPYHVLKKMFSY